MRFHTGVIAWSVAAATGRLPRMPPLTFRSARATDARTIAALHADSWRRHYRGPYAETFLDGDVLTDRLLVWRKRLRQPSNDSSTVIAEVDGQVVGFVHTVLDADPTWGALLDNLAHRQRIPAHGYRRAVDGSSRGVRR